MAAASHTPPDTDGIDGIDGTDGIDAIIEAFVDAFDAMLRLRPEPDAFDPQGRASMAAQIRPFVTAGVAIPALLPGFAHKNQNRDKALGPLPDLAEAAALRHLDAFCAKVAGFYAPGCRITLVADGRAWQDLARVTDADAVAYTRALRGMVARSTWLEAVGFDALMPDVEPGGAALEAAFFDADDRALIERMLRFAEQQPSSAAGQGIARMRRLIVEDGLKATPLQMLTRHRAFGKLLSERFPQHLRLSVHVQDDRGPKFGCRFGPAVPARGDTPILPYHGVAVLGHDDTIEMMHLADARALPGGVTIETRHGRPWCVRRNRP